MAADRHFGLGPTGSNAVRFGHTVNNVNISKNSTAAPELYIFE